MGLQFDSRLPVACAEATGNAAGAVNKAVSEVVAAVETFLIFALASLATRAQEHPHAHVITALIGLPLAVIRLFTPRNDTRHHTRSTQY